MSEATVRTEEYRFEGDAHIFKVKELVDEGNICRITIKNEEGKKRSRFRSLWEQSG